MGVAQGRIQIRRLFGVHSVEASGYVIALRFGEQSLHYLGVEARPRELTAGG